MNRTKLNKSKRLFIYHYSDKPLKQIETRMYRGEYTEEGLNKAVKNAEKLSLPGNYFEHISFMLGELPLDVAKMFKGQHQFYQSGSVFYKHKVRLVELKKTPWELVSSPEEVRTHRTSDVNWDDPIAKEQYNKLIHDLMVHQGYIGKGVDKLIKHIQRFSPKIRDYYIEWANSDDFKKLTQYSGGVPHIMAYPPSGRVRVTSVEKITLE